MLVIDILENDPTKPTPKTALISIKDSELRHAIRPSKRERGAAISDDDIDVLIAHIRKPQAILYDKQNDTLVYIFKGSNGAAKFIIDINDNDKGRIRNSALTAGKTDIEVLKGTRYEVLEGKL